MLAIAIVGAIVCAVSRTTTACGMHSASDPKYNGASYMAETLDLCEKEGQGFPANRLFTVYTRPYSYNPFGSVKCSEVSKHQYYLVNVEKTTRYGDQDYLKNTKYNTPHFPPCIQEDGTVHPTFVTTCMGRCGAGCGDGEDNAGVQAIGVGYTSSDLGAGEDAYKKCFVGCWYHDLCIYARECPKSVQWVAENGTAVKAPEAVMEQCNAKTNPSIAKCGALEYGPFRRSCTDDSANAAWPTKGDYLTDCVHARTTQAIGLTGDKKCQDEDASNANAVGAGIGWMLSALAFIRIVMPFGMRS